MSSSQSARQVLDRHYLEMRSKILDLAACFDRIEAAPHHDSASTDPRLGKLREGLEILLKQNTKDRAEEIQMLFSDAYVPGWMKQ